MRNIFLSLSLLACAGLHAQGDYQLSAFTADYVEISNADSWSDMNWDDPEIEIELGFPFTFGSSQITTMVQIGLGAEWGTISAEGANLISYGGDVISSADATDPGAPSIISWVVDGNPGNQILKVQYKDVAFWEEVVFSETAENRVNFQMWFYEQGGTIEFRFGPSNIVDPNTAYEGLSGPPIYFAGGINVDNGAVDFGGSLSGDVADPTLDGFNNLFTFFDELFGPNPVTLNGTPADGQVYRLSTTIVSTTELADQAFELFPTIAQQEVFLRGDLAPGMAYRIVNLNGSAVAAGVLGANRIDVSGLAAGMYLLQIDGTASAQKFVKR